MWLDGEALVKYRRLTVFVDGTTMCVFDSWIV
jgi:hypothetical protein